MLAISRFTSNVDLLVNYISEFLLFGQLTMLAKKNSKNQITLPKEVVASVGDVDYFDVTICGVRIVLESIQARTGGEVRSRLEMSDIRETDIDAAIEFARSEVALDKLVAQAQEDKMGY